MEIGWLMTVRVKQQQPTWATIWRLHGQSCVEDKLFGGQSQENKKRNNSGIVRIRVNFSKKD